MLDHISYHLDTQRVCVNIPEENVERGMGPWYTIVLIRVKYLILIEKDYSDAECLVCVDRETQIEENDVLIRDTSVDMQATRTDPVKTKAVSAPPLGTVLGTVTLPTIVPTMAAKMAEEFFTAAEDNDFAGDTVETHSIPPWASRDSATWLPDLGAIGYQRAAGGYRGREEQLVISAGCDMHTDDEGLVLMIVLHNDNLTFRQGNVRHRPKAGDWFIFDDRKPHAVIEADGRAMFIGWNIPIVSV